MPGLNDPAYMWRLGVHTSVSNIREVRMSRSIFLAFLLTAASAAAQVPPPPPPPPPPPAAPARDAPLKAGTATIRGRVVAAGTNAPMARVEVRAQLAESQANKMVTTDANGAYELTELPAGKFTVTAFKPNYIRVAHGQTKPTGLGKPVDVADGQTLGDINFALQRSAAITGKIVDEFGEPVTDVMVVTTQLRYINGERRMMPTGGRPIQTNDLGEYRLYGLTPGQYYLSATLRNLFMGGDTDDRSAYAATYFPGTANMAEAQRITVASGQTVAGVNMTLLPVHAARVSGTAFDSAGKPLAGAMVIATERIGFGIAPRGPSQVRPDGTFTLGGITPGDYILRVMGSDEVGMQPVTVTDGDVRGVQIVTGRQSTIRGHILVDRGATPPRASAFNVSVVGVPPNVGGGPGRINDDYTFELRATAGPNRIMAQPSGDWRLHAVRLNGVDITDSGLDVPANSVVEGVSIEMTTRVTEVTGKVMDQNGAPVRDAWVVVFAQDADRWMPPTRYVSAGRPDVSLAYHARVPEGDYFVVALEDLELGEWSDPEFLSRMRERATRVSVADGERKNLDVVLVKEAKQ